MKRKIQIGVMGSTSDLKYSKKIEKLAYQVGFQIAKSGNITVYGAEKDFDSLSTLAARGAKKVGGMTVGVTYGIGKEIWDKDGNTDFIVSTGMERGGGREFVLVSSCDVIIVLAGGSGTLCEISISYQLNIPVVALVGLGGWSDKLAGQYLDKRKRLFIQKTNTPKQAVEMAINLAKLDIK